MQTRLIFVPLVLLCCLSLIACAGRNQDQKVQIVRLPGTEKTVTEYPTIRSDALLCPSEPLLPDNVTTDTQLTAWALAVRDAGAECRQRLTDIRSLVATWPR